VRRIVYAMMVSLDGYVEGPDGGLGWSAPSEDLHRHFNDMYLTGEIGASLYGRRLYENMAAYWPTADENPSAPDVEVDFARAWKELPKVVFSRTLESVGWNATLEREVIPERILELKARPGGDMDVGGADLAATFIRLGLIDEYRLYVHPVVLGGGKPMFPADVGLDLEHVGSRTFEGGVVLLRYRPAARGEANPAAGP
jgi:dihydrofolate reductase